MTELPIYPEERRKAFDDQGIQWGWDATSILAYQTCPQYYKFSILDGWRSNEPGMHIRFGKHFADALEHYYKHIALGDDWEEALEKVVLEALVNTWDRQECSTCGGSGWDPGSVYSPQPCPDCGGLQFDGPGKPWDSGDTIKNRENLIRSIVWYADRFHDEPVQVHHLADGTPAVELSFQLPVDDGIIFAGHLDRVVSFNDDLYPMDQKTTGKTVTPRFFDQFKPNTQMSMYSFAGSAIFHTPVKGVIIDAAQIAVGFTRFTRGETKRTETELTEWYDQTLSWIQEAQSATRNQEFKMNPSSCFLCDFRKVCSVGPGLRQQFLKADFHQRTDKWDPLEAR